MPISRLFRNGTTTRVPALDAAGEFSGNAVA